MTRYRHLITDDNSKWWTLGAMCFALFMIMLDNTVVNVALPSIQRDLGSSLSGLEWTVNAYTLSFAVLLATGGRLGDIFGRRRTFLIGVVIFAASSVDRRPRAGHDDADRQPRRPGRRRRADDAGDALDRHQRLRAARARQGDRHLGRGLGAGAGDRPGRRRPADRARLLARDLLHQRPGRDRRPSLATLFAVRESRDETVGREVDYLGVATLTAGLTALVLALIEGNSWGWGSPAIVALFAGSVADAGAPSSSIERRVAAPIVEFPLFASRNFVGANLVALIVTFAMLAPVLLHRPLHAEHPRLLAGRGRGPLPAGDADDRRDRAARRAADRPDRAALADRRRPRAWSRSRSTG